MEKKNVDLKFLKIEAHCQEQRIIMSRLSVVSLSKQVFLQGIRGRVAPGIIPLDMYKSYISMQLKSNRGSSSKATDPLLFAVNFVAFTHPLLTALYLLPGPFINLIKV